MGIIEKCYLYGSCKCQTAGCVVLPDDGCPIYRYFRNLIIKDYKTRLKADMAAMLEELYMEIEEFDTPSDDSYDACIVDCEALIQQKINVLKAESEEI